MNKKLNWMKSSLMGSSTMPMGVLGGNPFPAAYDHTHVHSADGNCCGHDHHDHNADDDCGHDHVHGEHCNHGE